MDLDRGQAVPERGPRAPADRRFLRWQQGKSSYNVPIDRMWRA